MRTPPVFRPLGLALMAVAATGVLLQIGPASASSEKASRSTAATKQQALAAYAKLPLAFVPNAGQLDARVRYAAQAGGSSSSSRARRRCSRSAKGKRGVALRARLPRREPGRPRSRGARPGPGRVNYLLGNDPARWHTSLPTYERVVYRDLWPGVDMRLRGQSGTLEVRVPPRAGGGRLPDPPRLPRPASGSRSAEAESSASRPRSDVLRDARPVSYQHDRRQAGRRREPVRARARRRLRLRRRSVRPPLPARDRPGPRLLHLPGRKRLTTGASASRSTAPAAPT